MDEETVRKARTIILRWLSYRSRSLWEAERYLEKKGVLKPVAKIILTEMQEYRYLDDERFTEEVMQSCRHRGFGPYRARAILTERGVAPELILSRLGHYFNPEQDQARAAALVEKRTAHECGAREEKWLRRQVSYLKGRGFEQAVIMKALRQIYRGPWDETLS